MKKAIRLTMAILALAVLLSSAAELPAQAANEYEVKAAFLYKFASFIEWPPEISSAAICIAVLGQDPFGSTLDEVVKGKSIGGRGFLIKRLKGGEDSSVCQIVFIGLSERSKLRSILGRLRGTSALTVSDIPGFCREGGMIAFELLDQKVRFKISPEAAEREHLKLSSKLLSVAIIERQGSQ
jgi:hypothetical protein